MGQFFKELCPDRTSQPYSEINRTQEDRGARLFVVLVFLIWFSSLSFLGFGLGCFWMPYLQREFIRYGLARYRVLVGFLEVMGSIGLLAGLVLPWVGPLAAAGLSVLTLLGLVVRIKIRDSLLQASPAIVYTLLNGYLFYRSLG